MPVTQLEDNSGANLGSALGAVGGYLATKKTRDADKLQKQIDAKAKSARDDQQAQDYHQNIQSEIATRAATGKRDDERNANTQFQNGAYGTLSAMLRSKPQGVTAQQWVAHVQSQVPELKLTDPKLLGTLYGEAQDVLSKDQAETAAKFVKNEQVLPSDPHQALGVLRHRQQAEGGVPGVDPKRTQDAITAMEKQITEAQTAAHQAAIEKRQQAADAENKRHHLADENKPREGRSPSAQEQYFVQHGYMPPSYAEAHPKPKADKKSSTQDARGKDADDANAAIAKPGADRDKIVKHFSAKWNVPVDKASDMLNAQ